MKPPKSIRDNEAVPKLSASRFTWRKSAMAQGMSGMELWNHTTNEPRLNLYGIKSEPIGWCEADNIPVRARENEFVVMFYSHTLDGSVWIHVSPDEDDDVRMIASMEEAQAIDLQTPEDI